MKKIVVVDADTVVVVTGNVPATILMDHRSASLSIGTGSFLNPDKLCILNVFRFDDPDHTRQTFSVDVIKPQDDPHSLAVMAWDSGDPVLDQNLPARMRLVAVMTRSRPQEVSNV